MFKLGKSYKLKVTSAVKWLGEHRINKEVYDKYIKDTGVFCLCPEKFIVNEHGYVYEKSGMIQESLLSSISDSYYFEEVIGEVTPKSPPTLNWESLDDYTQRARVHGGWLVRIDTEVYHDRRDSMDYGWDWRPALTFVPDVNGDW